MPSSTLNLGVLAHVDAGKTTLTERLLFRAGVIDDVGSVDAGTTQTDSTALERRRGITIKAAVVSFPIGDVVVNVIDTPGHPDFIAEVERVLGVLDGAVLVVSAVEGVQPQTRVLMRALRRLRVPTLLFVNKIDRRGADPERVFGEIAARLVPGAVAMGTTAGAGTRAATTRAYDEGDDAFGTALVETLTANDDALLRAYVEDETGMTPRRLRAELAAQTARALAYPVFPGSAATGAGTEALVAGIAGLLPSAGGDPDTEVSGRVFKIEREDSGEKVAFVRLFAGTVRVRDRLPIGHGTDGKVTALSVFEAGAWVRRDAVQAGEIAKLWGLTDVLIGDPVGTRPAVQAAREFAPPGLETVVSAVRPDDGAALRQALIQLAEQDPLIDVRPDGDGADLAVSLYGEVQKEVIGSTLAAEYGLDVRFRETTVIHVERPAGAGEATVLLHAADNPFLATLGLRVEPAVPGSGVTFGLAVEPRRVPMYAFKTLDAFAAALERAVLRTFREGRYGWRVTDCDVTVVRSEYSSPDGPPATRGPLSTAADFRKLVPVVAMRALEEAGTVVCEPYDAVTVETPAATVDGVLAVLGRLGATARTEPAGSDLVTTAAVLPVARVRQLRRELAGVTRGDGVLESSFDGYRPVTGRPPVRRRSTADPRRLDDYLRDLGVRRARS